MLVKNVICPGNVAFFIQVACNRCHKSQSLRRYLGPNLTSNGDENADFILKVHCVILFLLVKNVSPIKIKRHLTDVYDDGTMRVQHVRKWHTENSETRTQVDERTGTSKTALNTVWMEEVISVNRQLIPPGHRFCDNQEGDTAACERVR